MTTEQKLERAIARIARLEHKMYSFGERLTDEFTRTARPMVAKIQRVIADHYGLQIGMMRSDRRPYAIAHPRQIAIMLSRDLTQLSQVEIGKCFGRDHGTVIHACRAVNDRCATSASYKQEVEMLRARCAEAIAEKHALKSAA